MLPQVSRHTPFLQLQTMSSCTTSTVKLKECVDVHHVLIIILLIKHYTVCCSYYNDDSVC